MRREKAALRLGMLTLLLTAPLSAPAQRLSRLQVSADGHSLVTADGRPFFWLGDTAWSLFAKLTFDEAAVYLRDRRANRFTVIQAHLLDANFDSMNEDRIRSFDDGDFDRPNEAYWRHVDAVIDEAGRQGLYMALLPAWARSYVEGKDAPLTDAAKAHRYGKFLGARYRERTHLVWVLGGDRRPTRHEVYDALARGLADGAAGGDQSRILITYHPPGGTHRPPATSTGEFYHDRPWLDFNMIQSGHRVGNRNYERIAEDYGRAPPKPTLDAEPCYEAHPILHDFKNGVFNAWHLRQRAYWSLLAGACGFTYGANGLWQMDKPGQVKRQSHHNHFWYDALKLEGGRQMKYVRALMESRPLVGRTPDQSILASPAGDAETRVQCARSADGSSWVIYVTDGRAISVDLGKVSSAKVRAWWYSPRDGRTYGAAGKQLSRPFQTLGARGTAGFDPPGAAGANNDWVLVLDDERKNYPAPGAAFSQGKASAR